MLLMTPGSWLLAEFLQLRAVVDLTASRITLAGLWLVGFLVCMLVVSQAKPGHKTATLLLSAGLPAMFVFALDWWAPKPTVEANPFSFKASPLLTGSKQKEITSDLKKFQDFLKSSGLEIPKTIPPIGVNTHGIGTASRQGNNPAYLDLLTIPTSAIEDRSVITGAYCWYAMESLIPTSFPTAGNDSAIKGTAKLYISEYLNWSFWGKPQSGFHFAGTQALWEMRGQFSPHSSFDRVIGFTVRLFNESPNRNWKQSDNVFFFRRLLEGDSVVDNESLKVAKLAAIWRKHGLATD